MRLQTYIAESSLSRVWQQVEDNKRSFAVVSASRGEYSNEENEERHVELKVLIRKMGYGFIEMKGSYRERNGFVSEKSLFIPSIKRKEAIELGKRFEQEGVLYKDDKEFVEIDPSNGNIKSEFIKSSGKDNLKLSKEFVENFFSRLIKGSHMNKKFAFNKFQLQERTHVWVFGRMGGRTPEWVTIYETTDIHNGSRKFAFNIQEKQDIGLWGRMSGREPEWVTIYETTDIHK
jgi:hypothetical protein